MAVGSRDSGAGPVVGGSSLLVIFAVLCLTVFALLGLSAVQADLRLSEAAVRSVTDYYRADCEAEELFARLRGGELPPEVGRTGDVYSYACPISETQELQVELSHEDGHWTVLRWQAVYTAEWEADQRLNVWDGSF